MARSLVKFYYQSLLNSWFDLYNVRVSTQLNMTYTRNNNKLNETEWDELVALKNAINYNPATVHPDKQEEFTAYLVQSLRERGG